MKQGVWQNIITMSNTKLSKLFITGCDHRTRWQLPWFLENFKKWNDTPIKIYDFDEFNPKAKGWFKKPSAMLDATTLADQVVWLDTDCEVLGNLDTIWKYIEPNKLAMCQDLPWSTRSGEMWHNSGVVGIQGPIQVLRDWSIAVEQSPIQGDQETLHHMLKDDLKRMIYISDIPRRFNVLRIDHLDDTVPRNPLIYHWTGHKGNIHIKGLIDG